MRRWAEVLVPRTEGFRPHQQGSCSCFLELADRLKGRGWARMQAPSPRGCWDWTQLNPVHYLRARAEVTRGTERLMLPLRTSLSGASGPRCKLQHCHLSAASFVWPRKEGRKVTFGHGLAWVRLSWCSAAPCHCFRAFLPALHFRFHT